MSRSSSRTSRRGLLVLVVIALPVLARAADPPRIAGFTSSKSAWQREYEARLKAIPDPTVCAEQNRALTAHPTLAGSDWDWWNVQYSLEKLRSYGLEPELKTYHVYMPDPEAVHVQVEMVAPTEYQARTKENGFPWQLHFDDVVVGFNAYSPPGEVTAELVYVNYGLPEDYAQLQTLGVDVRGKIAIARYGKVLRSVKNKAAHEHGAAGLILFSDPGDDGFVKGPVYPNGPWRPPDGIQRGTVMYLFNYSGDPLTPGWAATETAHRLDPAEAANLPHSVPTTPLAYGEAAPLLAAIGGPAVPDSWQGGLPFTYHVGPGPATVHLKVDIEYRLRPIWDIVVTIPGSKHPDQWVVLGAHRDGWTYGSNDSNSGFVVVMEMARALAELQAQGWRPERTIVLGGWDGEEIGILGSTEWAEEFDRQLTRNAVAYIDLDSAGGGSYFTAAGVPSLDAFVYDVAQEVEEPRTPGQSVYADWVSRLAQPVPPIDRLGGGYDYQVWIDHVGVPTIQMVFDYPITPSVPIGGNYHSAYDDSFFMERWGDPGYLHHAAMARLAGVAALRLANADILPFKYSTYASEVSGYLEQLSTQAALGGSPVDFARERSQAQAWYSAALELEAASESLLAQNASVTAELEGQVEFMNAQLIRQERDLTQARGLPGRSWFKHVIYAPGLYTGYAVQTLAALEEAVAAGDWATVRSYQALLRASLTTATRTATTAVRR